MEIGARSILIAVAVSAAVFLVGCDNVTMSTAQSPMAIAGIREALASEANTDLARDALLAARVTETLRSDPTTDNAEIYVSVSDGHARLSGFVETAAIKLRAGVLAAATDGIHDVDNRLILRYHADASQNPFGDAHVHL